MYLLCVIALLAGVAVNPVEQACIGSTRVPIAGYGSLIDLKGSPGKCPLTERADIEEGPVEYTTATTTYYDGLEFKDQMVTKAPATEMAISTKAYDLFCGFALSFLASVLLVIMYNLVRYCLIDVFRWIFNLPAPLRSRHQSDYL